MKFAKFLITPFFQNTRATACEFCKETFHIFHVRIPQKVKGVLT